MVFKEITFHLLLFKNHAFSFQKRGTFTTLTQIESDLYVYLTVQPVVPVHVTCILFSHLLEVSIVPVTCILHSHLLVVAVVHVTCILPLAVTVALVPVTCILHSHLLVPSSTACSPCSSWLSWGRCSTLNTVLQ